MNHLNWSKFIILSAEGSSKMLPIYANLVAQSAPRAQGRNKILVILDSDRDGRKRKRDLDQAGFGDRVIMLSQVVQDPKKPESARHTREIEIEDLFPPELFQQIVSSVYPNTMAPKLRVIYRRGIINAYKEGGAELDKVRLAEKFASEFAPNLVHEPWLDNFGKLFAEINRLAETATL